MCKRDIILSITGLQVFVNLYQWIKSLIKILFCRHVYQTWDMRLDASSSEIFKRFHGEVFNDSFRKCVKCGKQSEYLRRVPGQYGWKKTDRELPQNKKVIDVEIIGFGEETISKRRDRIINSILK